MNKAAETTRQNGMTIIRNTTGDKYNVVFLCSGCQRVKVDGPNQSCRRCQWFDQNRDRRELDTRRARWVLAGMMIGGSVVIAVGLVALHYLGAI